MDSVYLLDGGQVRSLSNPSSDLLQLFGAVTADGIPTGSTAALRYPASAAAIRLISSLAAECPVHAYRRGTDGSRTREREHPVEQLLNGFANPWTPSTDFVRSMTQTALLCGDAVAKVVRVRGEPRELHILKNVSIECDEATGEPKYRVPRKNGGDEVLNFRDVVHLKAPAGEAPAKTAARAIELALLIESHSISFFKNGGRPSGLLIFKKVKELADDLAAKIKSTWDNQTTGSRSGGVVPLGGDMEYKPLAFTSVDSQLLENRRHQVLEASRAFGVPPTLLAELEDASLNNSESLGRQFLNYGLGPWLTEWRGAITRALIAEEDRSDVYAEFETGALTRADLKARFEAYRLAVGGPWMVANEARQKDNLVDLPEGGALYPPQGVSAAPAQNPEADNAA